MKRDEMKKQKKQGLVEKKKMKNLKMQCLVEERKIKKDEIMKQKI